MIQRDFGKLERYTIDILLVGVFLLDLVEPMKFYGLNVDTQKFGYHDLGRMSLWGYVWVVRPSFRVVVCVPILSPSLLSLTREVSDKWWRILSDGFVKGWSAFDSSKRSCREVVRCPPPGRPRASGACVQPP